MRVLLVDADDHRSTFVRPLRERLDAMTTARVDTYVPGSRRDNDKLAARLAKSTHVIVSGSSYDVDRCPVAVREAVAMALLHCIQHRKKIFGVCFGAQAIVDLLGCGRIVARDVPHVGIYHVTLVEDGSRHRVHENHHHQIHMYDDDGGPLTVVAIQGDEVAMLAGFGGRVVATQFHPEVEVDGRGRTGLGKALLASFLL